MREQELMVSCSAALGCSRHRKLKNRIDRWSQVERYKNDKDIRGALEKVLDRANYRALMKAFAEDALSPDSGVSEDERRILLACLERAERGEKVTADSLPRITNRAGRLMIGAWLTNATRQDLGGMPTMEVRHAYHGSRGRSDELLL